jgi:hypothetical protein
LNIDTEEAPYEPNKAVCIFVVRTMLEASLKIVTISIGDQEMIQNNIKIVKSVWIFWVSDELRTEKDLFTRYFGSRCFLEKILVHS